MNPIEMELTGRRIARNIVQRDQALAILTTARNGFSLCTTIAVPIGAIAVAILVSTLSMPLWPKLIISVTCALAIGSTASLWRIQRQCSAAIALILAHDRHIQESSANASRRPVEPRAT